MSVSGTASTVDGGRECPVEIGGALFMISVLGLVRRLS